MVVAGWRLRRRQKIVKCLLWARVGIPYGAKIVRAKTGDTMFSFAARHALGLRDRRSPGVACGREARQV